MKKTFIKFFITLIVCSIVGYLLLVFSYMLPSDTINHNVLITSKSYLEEGDFPNMIPSNEATKIGNHTDELMLLESVYDGNESPFIKAINVSRKEIPNKGYANTLYNLDNILYGMQQTNKVDYTRYWHGYLIILKPLLLLFNHSQIRYLNMIVQSFLLVVVLYLMLKRGLNKYIIPLLLSICSIYPQVIAMTMQFSIVYYITLISLIVLLSKWEKIKENLPLYFWIIGILICYFDYFTWPLVTLGIPLVIATLLKKDSVKNSFTNILFCGLSWLLGYALMWLMKFSIGSLIVNKNLFIDGFQQIAYRSSLFSEEYFASVSHMFYNFQIIFVNRVNVIVSILFIAYVVVNCIKKKVTVKNLILNIPLLLISIIPFVWFYLVMNHSYTHFWMAYRILVITIFAVQCYLTSLYNE